MSPEQGYKNTWIDLMKGYPDALSGLYREHYLGLVNYGIKLTGDRERSNDCIIQVIIDLWDKRKTLPVVENVRSYLLTSLRRKIFAEIKAEKKRDLVHDAFQSVEEKVELSYEVQLAKIQSDLSLKQKLLQSFSKLTERQKELLQMRFFEDLNYDEIAAKCEITKRTAYNIIYDAIKILKEELSKDQSSSFLFSLAIPTLLVITLLSAPN